MDFDTQMESNSHGIDNIGLDFTDLEDFILHDHPSKIIHGKALISLVILMTLAFSPTSDG